MITGTIIHLIVLPYADMTLLAANSPIAIIANSMCSIWLFGEKFLWKYDLPAIVMIISGSISIVMLANTQQAHYDGQALLDLISEPKAILFFCFVAALIIITHIVLRIFYKKLRAFETDANHFDDKIR